MAKGQDFEREICTDLSKWWTNGERDDVFWRHDSGSRAKGRSRKGKKTFGAYGDIKASDPIGLPLTNLCVIEIKRGYKNWSFLDCLDHPEKQWNQKERTKQTFERFVEQVEEDAATAKTWPVIIAKRDKRQKIIIVPESMLLVLEEMNGQTYSGFEICIGENEYISRCFIAMHFFNFLEWCRPQLFIDLDKKMNKKRKKK